MTSRLRALLMFRIAALMALLLSAACEDNRSPIQPTPTVTDVFTGTLSQQSTSTHPFTVEHAGVVTVALVTLDPLSEITVGLGLGSPSGSDCTLRLKNDTAVQGSILTAAATTPGSYCLAIYDVGNVSEDVSYTIQLTHP